MWTADKVIYRNEDDFVRAYQYDTLVWEKVSQNVVFYTSTDGNVVTPRTDVVAFIGKNGTEWVEANVISNTYSNGLGIILLDREVIQIGQYAFYGKSKLKSIVIPSTVTRLASDSFTNCSGLTSVTIPSSVLEIGNNTFSISGGSMTSMTIPSSVTYIGDWGLSVDSLSTLIVNNPTPPTISSSLTINVNIQQIRVPASSVQAYKTASGWSTFASKIVAQ